MSIAPDPNATENYGQPAAAPQPYGPPPAAPQTTSGLSIAGFVLAFIIAPIGFILSVVALVKIKASAQKGKGLAIAGVIISVLGMIGWALIIATVIAVAPTAAKLADPGCVDGKAAINNLATVNGTDSAALETGIADIRTAAAKSKHDDVRAAITAVADDYTQIVQAAKAGDQASTDQLVKKSDDDIAKVNSLCTVGGK
jgi:hypothetical protein